MGLIEHIIEFVRGLFEGSPRVRRIHDDPPPASARVEPEQENEKHWSELPSESEKYQEPPVFAVKFQVNEQDVASVIDRCFESSESKLEQVAETKFCVYTEAYVPPMLVLFRDKGTYGIQIESKIDGHRPWLESHGFNMNSASCRYPIQVTEIEEALLEALTGYFGIPIGQSLIIANEDNPDAWPYPVPSLDGSVSDEWGE